MCTAWSQAPAQRQQLRTRDTRPPFSIADLKDVMQAAQQAALQGRQPDVSALAARCTPRLLYADSCAIRDGIPPWSNHLQKLTMCRR